MKKKFENAIKRIPKEAIHRVFKKIKMYVWKRPTRRTVLMITAFLTFSFAMYSYINLYIDRNEAESKYSDVTKEYKNHKARAGSARAAMVATIKKMQRIPESIPYCSDDMRQIYNKDFNPPVPFFSHLEDLENVTFSVNMSRIPKDVTPLFFTPQMGFGSFPMQSITHGENMTITLDYKNISPKLKAYDFTILGSKANKVCRMDARLYLGKSKTEDKDLTIQPVPLTLFGRTGLEWGYFTLPYGTDIDQERDTIIISDCINGLIQEMDFSGHLIRIIGGNGTEPAQMARPADVKVQDNKIYVIEENNHRYQVFNREGDYISMHGSRVENDPMEYEEGQEPKFNYPLGIALDKAGFVYAVDHNNRRVQKLSPDGKVVKMVGGKEVFNEEALQGPYYIDINQKTERVYVVDRNAHRVVVFDQDLEYLFTFGAKGSGDGQLDWPHEIEIAPDGRLFIADTYNYRIMIFDADGQYLDQIAMGEKYGYPKTVAVSDKGYVISGHVGDNEAYMAVWADPKLAKDAEEAEPLLEKITTMTPKSSPDLKYQKAQVEKEYKDTVYQRVCMTCHNSGSFGAPRSRVEEDWEDFPRNLDELLKLVRKGEGAMMPSGGCEECTDEELIEAIKYMLPKTWDLGE